jgi:hypothetical protein
LRLTDPCANPAEAVRWSFALKHAHRWRMKNLESSAVAFFQRSGPSEKPRVGLWLTAFAPEDKPRGLVLGQHHLCDLSQLTGANPRHALMVLWPRFDGRAPDVDVLDLLSPTGLISPQGTCARRFLGSQILRFGIGSIEITVLTAGPGQPFLPQWPGEIEAQVDVEENAFTEKSTSVERTMPKNLVEMSASIFVRRDHCGNLFRRDSRDLVDLEKSVVVSTTASQLRQGLLIGRCHRAFRDQGISSKSVSRVHAALYFRDGLMHVVDAGSTNGTVVSSVQRFAGAKPILLSKKTGRTHILQKDEGIFIGNREVVFEIHR